MTKVLVGIGVWILVNFAVLAYVLWNHARRERREQTNLYIWSLVQWREIDRLERAAKDR